MASAATVLAIVATALFLTLGDSEATKASETHLAAAQIIGAALALVLSLSIIPAQRAAELFSIAILKLFGRNRALMGVFAILVTTTLISLLLGSGFSSGLSSRLSISLQFLLLGVSFDAIRHFYVTTLDLLAPEAAIRSLISSTVREMHAVDRTAKQLCYILLLESGSANGAERALRAWAVTAARVPVNVRQLASQLEEFAHRFIARRDSNATIEVIDAIQKLAYEFLQLRADSITLHIDPEYLFAGPQSDVADVLNPIYENVHRLIEDSIALKNERVVQHAINVLGQMMIRASSMVTTGANGEPIAPLAFGSSFYFDRSVRLVLAAGMDDAILSAVRKLRNLLLEEATKLAAGEVNSQIIETLFAVTLNGYARKNQVQIYLAVKTMLLASWADIKHNRFDANKFRSLLSHFVGIMPFEVDAYLKGERPIQCFPAYDLGFDASIPMFVQAVAENVKSDPERTWIDPFNELSDLMEVVRDHYRKLSEVDFKDTLLRKWVLDSLNHVLRVLINLLATPPTGTEGYVQTVFDHLNPQISWFSAFFPPGDDPSRHHLSDATGQLTVLAIDALEKGWKDIAERCAKTLSDIAINLEHKISAFELADIHVGMEAVARASEAVGEVVLKARVRAMISYPANLKPELQAYYASARSTRFAQFEEALEEASRSPRGRTFGPAERLSDFIERRKGAKSAS